MQSYTRDLQEAKQRSLTPFEIIRDEWYQTIMEREMKWIKSIDDVSRFAMLNQTVIKPNSMVNFSTKYKRRFNQKSLDNLVQNQPKEVDKELKLIKNEKEITDVNDWSQEYIDQYENFAWNLPTSIISPAPYHTHTTTIPSGAKPKARSIILSYGFYVSILNASPR